MRPLNSRWNEGCPNIEFVDKYINSLFPNTVDGARQSAMRVGRMRFQSITAQTTLHTVFNAPAMSYTESGSRCRFVNPAPKYDCTLANNNWNCVYHGEERAEHNLHTGHYYPPIIYLLVNDFV